MCIRDRFYNFINDQEVQLIGCEAAGKGVDTALTAATIKMCIRDRMMVSAHLIMRK